jgi:hypothetical protein
MNNVRSMKCSIRMFDTTCSKTNESVHCKLCSLQDQHSYLLDWMEIVSNALAYRKRHNTPSTYSKTMQKNHARETQLVRIGRSLETRMRAKSNELEAIRGV